MSAAHLGKRKVKVRSVSSLGDLKATRERQSCLKLVTGNSLRSQGDRRSQRIWATSLDVLGISSTLCRGSNTVEFG